MTLHEFGKSIAAGALALILPGAAPALEQVTLQLAGRDNPDLAESLLATSVLESLETTPETPPRDVIAAAQADYTRLVETLYAQGYYSAVVNILIDGQEAARIDPFRAPARIGDVIIRVAPGPLFTLGQAEIGPLVGDNPPVEAFRTGAPALATVVRDAAQTAVSDWEDGGHAKARVSDQDITARHPSARLDVAIGIAPGPRVRFGDTAVTGDTDVRDPRVRQIAGLPQGEVYSPAEVEKAASRLRRTGTFRSVVLTEAETVNPDGTLDYEINVIDRKPRRLGAGLEVSNYNGLSANAYWIHRNLFGGAERLRLDAEVSQIGVEVEGIDYGLSFRFEKPAVYGPDTSFHLEGGLTYEDEPDFIERTVELKAGVSREFTDNLTGELGVGVSYSEITDRFDDPETFRALQLLTLPGALTYDRRDDELNTTSGYYIRAEATPFYETIEGQPGAHLTLDARAYRAFGEQERFILANRLQLGALVGPEAADAPPGMLFYSGGGGTVRGQPYQSLDATYDDGATLGGKLFAGWSTEGRFGVTDTIGVVAFADAGWIAPNDFDDAEMHAGAGLGLRYKTPVGPIRLDVAAPVAGDTGEGVQVYIGIGQAF